MVIKKNPNLRVNGEYRKSLWTVTSAMKLKTLAPWRKAGTNLDSLLKSRDITLPTLVVQSKLWFFQ